MQNNKQQKKHGHMQNNKRIKTRGHELVGVWGR